MFSSLLIQRPHLPTLAVTASTENPEILFIHGCTETAETWFPLMQALADAGVGSAAVDLRGHGKSHGHEALQDAGIKDYVADARNVFEHFSTLRVAVGHSMGGLVTQLLASELKLNHAVLIASSPVSGMKADGIRMARKHFWTFLMASIRRSFKRLYINERVTRSLLFHSNTPAVIVQMVMSKLQEDSWRAGNEMNTLLPDPSAVSCPVTVIGGREDFMVSHASTEATASAYKTKAIYLDQCAHMVPLEAEAKQLAHIILTAIRSAELKH
jgi:alpha-beta hydrolase superfamily lysophospholipase